MFILEGYHVGTCFFTMKNQLSMIGVFDSERIS